MLRFTNTHTLQEITNTQMLPNFKIFLLWIVYQIAHSVTRSKNLIKKFKATGISGSSAWKADIVVKQLTDRILRKLSALVLMI